MGDRYHMGPTPQMKFDPKPSDSIAQNSAESRQGCMPLVSDDKSTPSERGAMIYAKFFYFARTVGKIGWKLI